MHRGAQLRRTCCDLETRVSHDLGFLRRAVTRGRDDRARVAHPPPSGRGKTGDIADDRLRGIGCDPDGSLGFLRPADLADHEDRVGLGVLLEELEHVEKRRAIDGISADPDARGNADAEDRHLRGGFVAERSRARDDSDPPTLVDVAGHDPDHRFSGADDARAVGSDERRPLLARIAAEIALDAHHVLCGDPVGDGDREADPAVGRFHDRIARERARYENAARRGAGHPDGVLDRVEHGKPEVGGTALARCDATDDRGAVGDHLPGVERGFVAREPLEDDPGVLVDEDAHRAACADPAPALTSSPSAATALRAASASDSAGMMCSPLSLRMRRPSSTFVPASRATMGTLMCWSRAAWTTPWAIQSQRLMPAKMFTSTTLTRGSDRTRRKAAATRSGDAPPPTSRKFAGSAPASLIMSIVAMANPAPLTMQPICPSSPT